VRWSKGRRSDNIEDRRGMRVSRGMVGGGVGTLIMVLVALYLGADPTIILQQAPPVTGPPAG
jgi:predicted metalloprotease